MVKGLVLHPVIGDKRQPDQRILQAFRLVNGDDLHQVFITLETHLLARRVTVRIGNLLREPAHQGMLTFQLRARLLQQFADMQNIGQTALTACRGEQILSNVTLPHQFTQHRHHAAFLPALAVMHKLFDHRIPGGFVVI